MRVRFQRLLPDVLLATTPHPGTPAAEYKVSGAGRAQVLLQDVHPFVDLPLHHWPRAEREAALLGLCESVREAPWKGDARHGLLDLATRFSAGPDRDVPSWRVAGFESIGRVDLKVVAHVLGRGEHDPERAVDWWTRRLGVQIDPAVLCKRLSQAGCTAWERVAPGPGVPDLYAGVRRLPLARSLRVLAPLREGYMLAVRDAVTRCGELARARHTHMGTAADSLMHFLDDDGLYVVARGDRRGLEVATSFGALAGGEVVLGPLTRRKRWARVVQDLALRPRGATIHSPLSWVEP